MHISSEDKVIDAIAVIAFTPECSPLFTNLSVPSQNQGHLTYANQTRNLSLFKVLSILVPILAFPSHQCCDY